MDLFGAGNRKRKMEIYGCFEDLSKTYAVYTLQEKGRAHATLSRKEFKYLKRAERMRPSDPRRFPWSLLNVIVVPFELAIASYDMIMASYEDREKDYPDWLYRHVDLEVRGEPVSKYEAGVALLKEVSKFGEDGHITYSVPVKVFSIEGVPDTPITIEPLTHEQVQNLLKIRDEVNRQYPR